MKVSVVIPSYNGAHKILGVLKALEKQTFLPDEVIVILDGSTDNTEAILKAQEFRFKCFKVISQKNSGRSKVRNNAARFASGDLLIFFDDDMRPAPYCLEVHRAHHHTYPGSILTGSAIEEVVKGTSDMVRFKAYLSRLWSEPYKKEEILPLSKEQAFITAANFSVAKSTFETLGGFDERLTDAEDFDLATRAFNMNIPLYVNLQAHAWHDDKVTCQSYIRRLRQYQIAQQKLTQIKPELYSNNKFYSHPPIGLKRKIFTFFAKPFWIKLVDQDGVLKILPKKLRYKLYDVIVTANGVYFPERVKL